MRSAADPRTAEDEHVVEVLDPLNPVELCRGKPQEPRQVPLALRDLFVWPPLAGFHDTDPVTLLRGSESGNASTESRANDNDVVVEFRHEVFPSPTRGSR